MGPDPIEKLKKEIDDFKTMRENYRRGIKKLKKNGVLAEGSTSEQIRREVLNQISNLPSNLGLELIERLN